MKKLIAILLITVFCLASCKADTENIDPVRVGFENFEPEAYSFTLRVELEGKKCVLLASGDIKLTYSPNTLSGEIEETVFGAGIGIMKISWKDGTLTTDGRDESVTWEELRGSLTYAVPLVFENDEISSASSGVTKKGTKYRHEIKDNSKNDLLYSLLGEGLPEICGLAKVVKEKTKFEDILCEYVIGTDGTPVSYGISFNVIYQDTPPYVPGVQQDEAEYTTDVRIEFLINY